MTSCAFCGRDNDAGSRFCIDCGKPINPSAARAVPSYNPGSTPSGLGNAAPAPAPAPVAARAGSAAAVVMPAPAIPPARGQPVGSAGAIPTPPIPLATPGAVPAPLGHRGQGARPVTAPQHRIPAAPLSPGAAPAPCPRCGKVVDRALPFCGHCGTRVRDDALPQACTSCGATYTEGVDLFCARCGNRVGSRVSVESSRTAVFSAARQAVGPRLSSLGDDGEVASTFTLERGDAVIGRGDADIRFPDDVYLSPLHARLELREGVLWLRDLGSRNMSWTFVDGPAKLADGDVVLVGSQVLRFRRLGYPGPFPPEADATRRMGSLIPVADVAVMEQLRSDGSVRDVYHLSPGRHVTLGRETGDWLFPYDQTMSARHAEVRSEDSDFYIQDVGSRNGVAVAVRGERALKPGQRLLLGDQILRVESV